MTAAAAAVLRTYRLVRSPVASPVKLIGDWFGPGADPPPFDSEPGPTPFDPEPGTVPVGLAVGTVPCDPEAVKVLCDPEAVAVP